MSYMPGSHVIASLSSKDSRQLVTYQTFRTVVNGLIKQYNLEKLGEVYHNFQPAGFTAVICLSESHISVHTWPEYGKINLDIYLSNFQRTNDDTVLSIYRELISHFNASVDQSQIIYR